MDISLLSKPNRLFHSARPCERAEPLLYTINQHLRTDQHLPAWRFIQYPWVQSHVYLPASRSLWSAHWGKINSGFVRLSQSKRSELERTRSRRASPTNYPNPVRSTPIPAESLTEWVSHSVSVRLLHLFYLQTKHTLTKLQRFPLNHATAPRLFSLILSGKGKRRFETL